MDLSKDNRWPEASPREVCGRSNPCNATCTGRDACTKLRDAGVRLTSERLELAQLLFEDGDRHFTPDALYEEAQQKGIRVSLATIYNNLKLFLDVGLLKRLSIDSPKAWYDTNISEHYHFYCEEEDRVLDVDDSQISFIKMPPIPGGMELSRVEVVLRLKRKSA
jgi:Fur family iron response transcriptional regulator